MRPLKKITTYALNPDKFMAERDCRPERLQLSDDLYWYLSKVPRFTRIPTTLDVVADPYSMIEFDDSEVRKARLENSLLVKMRIQMEKEQQTQEQKNRAKEQHLRAAMARLYPQGYRAPPR